VYAFFHIYPNGLLKTITIYHDDDNRDPALELNSPNNNITNVRGTFPKNMQHYYGAWFYYSSAENSSTISNWNTISSITSFTDGISAAFPQDFMTNNKNLSSIDMTYQMPISHLKSNWNTYFTQIVSLTLETGVSYGFEDLTGLIHLSSFIYTNTLWTVTTTTLEVDNIINQIAAGAGQFVSNGSINLGFVVSRSSNSDTSVSFLKTKGWTITINGTVQ
jgi:hypothetical protein